MRPEDILVDKATVHHSLGDVETSSTYPALVLKDKIRFSGDPLLLIQEGDPIEVNRADGIQERYVAIETVRTFPSKWYDVGVRKLQGGLSILGLGSVRQVLTEATAQPPTKPNHSVRARLQSDEEMKADETRKGRNKSEHGGQEGNTHNRQASSGTRKLIFVSHKETDQSIASHLVDCLLSAIFVEDAEVRCTSVPGHQLPFGVSIAEQLRSDLNTSAVVVALLTRDSLESRWVLFELGASWALSKTLVPILGPGLDYPDLPGPLISLTAVRIEGTDASVRLRDAIRQIAMTLGVSEQTGGKVEAKLQSFIEAFRQWRPVDTE